METIKSDFHGFIVKINRLNIGISVFFKMVQFKSYIMLNWLIINYFLMFTEKTS